MKTIKTIKKIIGFSLVLTMQVALGALDLELTKGVDQTIPIAIVPFTQTAISDVINSDLKNCGQFTTYVDTNTDYNYWRQQKINAMVTGVVTKTGHDQYKINFQLVDLYNQKTLLDKQFTAKTEQFRALGHHLSDLIYEELIGIKGIFSTKIVYVLTRHNASLAQQFSLWVADADGYNARQLLFSPEPIMSPSWSPDGQQIAYVSFEKKQAAIYLQNLATGKRSLLTQYPGINGAPAWSPDGQKMAMVLTLSDYPKIYVLDLSTKNLSQVTSGLSLDTEPKWSPDGQKIIFTSNSGGSPQIYQLDLTSKKIDRLTFNSNYNACASFTPDGKKLVMLNRDGGTFNIAVQNLTNGRIDILDDVGINKSPSVAPNGSMLIYATVEGNQGILKIVSIDGKVKLRLPTQEGDVQDPAWSPLFNY